MPATLLSHQALVLPLKMKWPRHFSGLGLCLGSMAPDFEFIARMTDDWIFSHTFWAQLWFSVPVTLGLVWLITRLLIPTLLPYLSEVQALRLHDLAALQSPTTPRRWLALAISAWIGGLSHIFLDGMTHDGHSGWMVPLFPVLRTTVPQFGGAVPLYDALQSWLTIALGFASLCMWRAIARKRMLWKWQTRDAEPQRIMPRRTGTRLTAIYAIAAGQGALVGLAHHFRANTPNMYAALLFGAIDFLFCALVVSAVVVRSMSEGSRARTNARPARDATLISA